MAAQAWLDKKFQNKWVLKCTTEVNSTEKTGTETLTTRTDVEWSLETPADAEGDGPETPRRVAVMEYKRKHLINPTELSAARYDQEIEVSKFKLKAPTSGGSPTYFQGTAFWLVKQVKGYQKLRNVKDVCLFDWDTMFILNFDPKEKQNNPELWPAGILYQEQANSPEGAAAEAEATFRSLLLAFLIRALKRELNEPLDPVKYAQSRSTGNDGGENPAQSDTSATKQREQTILVIYRATNER